MKRQWHVRREAVGRPNAQGRWDQAYQAILRWSLENERGHEQARTPSANGKQEYHERVAAYVRVSTSRQVKLQTTLSSSWRWCESTPRSRDGSCPRSTSSATTATAGRR